MNSGFPPNSPDPPPTRKRIKTVGNPVPCEDREPRLSPRTAGGWHIYVDTKKTSCTSLPTASSSVSRPADSTSLQYHDIRRLAPTTTARRATQAKYDCLRTYASSRQLRPHARQNRIRQVERPARSMEDQHRIFAASAHRIVSWESPSHWRRRNRHGHLDLRIGQPDREE